MTDLVIKLSTQLQQDLKQSGVWAYATVFSDTITTANLIDLVNDGSIINAGTTTVSLPTTLNGGKVYLIVQSEDPAMHTDLKSVITQQSQINWENAGTYDFRYDSFEVTLSGSPFDAGNLSSVQGFGIPMEASVTYENGATATVGYGVGATKIHDDIRNINTAQTYLFDYQAGPLAGTPRMAISPTTSVPIDGPFLAADWDGYVASLEGPAATNVVISGEFNGAATTDGVWHNGGYFAYQLEWDGQAGAFWLDPLPTSQIQGFIKISPANLANSIYSTLGTVDIYADKTDASPFLAAMNTGLNNQWGKVLSSFLPGFTGGFYGQQGLSLNPQVTTPVNLDQNLNWDPVYAFGTDPGSPNAPHLVPKAPNAYQDNDQYSGVFYFQSNSYGSNYSDALMSQYAVGGPLLSVSQPTGSANVPEIDLTLFADNETPQGYTTPAIYNYIAPDGGAYVAPSTAFTTNSLSMSFTTQVADNTGMVVAKDAAVTLNILKSDAGGAPKWYSVTLDGSIDAIGLWRNWDISYDAGNDRFTAAPGASPDDTLRVGAIVLRNFPTATNGVSWYQVAFGDKTYNVYARTSGGKFENPLFAGNDKGALAVDGLAKVTPGETAASQTIGTFAIDFAPGSTVTYDPSLLVPNPSRLSTDLQAVFPNAPVAGTLSGSNFTALPGQTNQISNSITTTLPNIAFGWTGENNYQDTPSWISNYTNKIDPLTVALVTLTPAVGTPITAIATADVDGVWQTPAVALPLGTNVYTVTMQEYLPGDTKFTTPLTNPSTPLTLTANIACFAAGTPIRTIAGDVPVERLDVGAILPTAAGRGEARVVWIGHRTVDGRRHPRPQAVSPVRICRSAFGPALPERDLLLSPDHAVFADDVLIPVRYLVNGSTIRREAPRTVTYYHVELERHDVLLAAGLPVESYLDIGNRDDFAGEAEVIRLHPEFGAWTWEATACAPLVVTGPVLQRVRRRLQELAVAQDRGALRIA